MSAAESRPGSRGALRLVDAEREDRPRKWGKPIVWLPADPPTCEVEWQAWVSTREQDESTEPMSPVDHLYELTMDRDAILRRIATEHELDRIVAFIQEARVWCGERRWLLAFASSHMTLRTLLTEHPSDMRAYYSWWNEKRHRTVQPFLEALGLEFGMTRAQYDSRVKRL
jgi:hypothetical protein